MVLADLPRRSYPLGVTSRSHDVCGAVGGRGVGDARVRCCQKHLVWVPFSVTEDESR